MASSSLILLTCLLLLIGFVYSAKSPNIVFILTDDLDVELGGMLPLTKTKKLIGDQGVTFNRLYVSTPLCCPSRSSILTGKYVHNHGVANNSVPGNCAGLLWQQTQEPEAFPVHLKHKGYKTFFAGKYLNHYGYGVVGGIKHVPPGWDEWNALMGNSRYYNFTLSVNGKAEVHGDDYADDYLTDVINRKGMEFLNKQNSESDPFFMMLSTPSPHAPFTPAPQHAGTYNDLYAPRNGSFNTHANDKHWLIRQTVTPMPNFTVDFLDDIYRKRWETLLSVDEIAENVVKTLSSKGMIDNTYVIFTSDNGYHFGQFSLPNDKRQLYQFDVRVPLMIRGPGIQAGTINNDLVSSVDLAPTFLDIADHGPVATMDGTSMLPRLKGGPALNRSYVVVSHEGEYGNIKECPQLDGQRMFNCESNCVCEDAWNNTYSCIVGMTGGQHFKYCQFIDEEDFEEAYDIFADSCEMTNMINTLKQSPAVHEGMKNTLSRLSTCAGPNCLIDPGHLAPDQVRDFFQHRPVTAAPQVPTTTSSGTRHLYAIVPLLFCLLFVRLFK